MTGLTVRVEEVRVRHAFALLPSPPMPFPLSYCLTSHDPLRWGQYHCHI